MVTVLGLLVAGCTDDPAPVETTPASTPSPTPTAPATPSPTPTLEAATAPTRPEEMSTASADGAAAAASYLLSLYPYARSTGDIAAWEALSGEECTFCASVSQEVADLTARQESVRGGTITIESATGTEIIAGESYSAELVFTESPTETWRDSSLVSTGDGGRYEALVVLRWTATEWEVRAVDLTPAP